MPLLREQIGELHLGLSPTVIRKDVNQIVLMFLHSRVFNETTAIRKLVGQKQSGMIEEQQRTLS